MTEKINQMRRLRFELQLDQEPLAKELGVTQAYISMIERGERRITPVMAEKLNRLVKERLN